MAPIDLDAARESLQDAGVRATEQRIVVLAAMRSIDGDVTAQALHERLQRAGHDLGLATVYRALGVLAESGLIDALQHGASTCWRACAPGHHHHLTCDRCHAVVELHDCDVDDWADRVARQYGFSEVRHVVELHGTCADCSAA